MLVVLNRQLCLILKSSVTLLNYIDSSIRSMSVAYTQLTVTFDSGVQRYLHSINSRVLSRSSVLLALKQQ